MKQTANKGRVFDAAQARRLLVAKIHIGRTQLSMDDDSYRANLEHYGNGKNSCTNMTVPELHAVLAAFEKLGFKPKKATKKQPGKKYSPSTADGPKDERSVIRAIWIFMHRADFIRDGSETALNAWVARQTVHINSGAGIQSVQWLEGSDATHVLEALKKWCRRLMYSDLQKRGYDVWPTIDYQTLLEKWERANGAMV
ncbi:gp16 family protein [Rheinheimera baltica]|uniref:gp16 family protein n=1 Tax=Rheinheimera baltica TaxID=67576 RepID=UPI0003F4B926|nr:regulatory protein GemA [Rheinheimera baltica]